jgi:hypothetical protein
MNTCRISTTHLEPVEGGERLLNREISSNSGGCSVATGKVIDHARRAEAVVPNCKQRVAQATEGRAGRFDRFGLQSFFGLQSPLRRHKHRLKLVDSPDDAGGQFMASNERLYSGNAAQQVIDSNGGFSYRGHV